jgi:hypothetical protein
MKPRAYRQGPDLLGGLVRAVRWLSLARDHRLQIRLGSIDRTTARQLDAPVSHDWPAWNTRALEEDRMRPVRLLLLAVAVLTLAAPVAAQAPIPNPSVLEFTASADHNAVILGGTDPLVTRYDLELYLEGAALPFQTYSVGKPTPDAQNKIIVTNRAWFIGSANNVRCIARVVAVGPTGVGRSEPSNPFGNVGPPAVIPAPPVVR